jgi:HK97 gp10 family phage protein
MPDDGVTMEVEGLAALMAKLDDLSTKGAERASRKAVRAGGEIAQAAIIENAPVKVEGIGGTLPPGALKNDIVLHTKKQSDGSIIATVGPDKLTSHVARWVEYGHRQVVGGRSRLLANGTTRGPGKQVYVSKPGAVGLGTVPQHPFIRPAWESVAQEVAAKVQSTLATEIENEARKG